MPLRTTSSPILPQRKGGVPLSDRIEQLRRRDPLTAEVISGLAGELNYIGQALRQAPPSLTDVIVTDPNGKPITRIGSWVEGGVLRSGFWASEFYQGGEDADTAIIYSDENGQLVIGKNGSATVLDPYGGMAAWLGAQWDALDVTGAADNGSGLIRLTVAAHGLTTGDSVIVGDVGGVPNATGTWLVTVIDPNTIDLQGSGFGGAYTSGGWVSRVLHVSGAADNGAGLIRLTVTSHGYESGDRVNVQNVGGVPAASGQWTVTVVDANTLDLEGSAFAGAYTAGGTCVRYFAGLSAQTIAIGESFANYKLRAFADGSLRIRDASITLELNGVRTTITNELYEGTYYSLISENTAGNPDAVGILPGRIDLRAGVANDIVINLEANNRSIYVYDSTGAHRQCDLGSIFGYGALMLRDGAGTVQASLLGAVAPQLSLGGNKVVGPRAATAPTKTARAAGAAYGANEQAMLNELKAWQDAVDARLNSGGHGLWP